MIRFSNPGIHPGPGRLKGGRADHASARIRLRDPWCFRSDPSCGARPRSAAARPGGGGPEPGMNRGGGGRQEAGFPQEPAPKFSTATPWFVSGSRNIRGARLPDPGRGVPEGAASLTEAVPDRVPEGPVRRKKGAALHFGMAPGKEALRTEQTLRIHQVLHRGAVGRHKGGRLQISPDDRRSLPRVLFWHAFRVILARLCEARPVARFRD